MGERAPEMTAEEFSENLKDWDFIDVNGAVMMKKGAEIHVAALPNLRGHWITRKAIREYLPKILNEHGKIETFVMVDNKVGEKFVERLGFTRIGERGPAIHYELRKLRHA